MNYGSLNNKLLAYFDLQSKRRGVAIGYGGESLSVFPQYVAFVLGVIVQPFMTKFRVSGIWDVTFQALIGWTVFAVLVGLAVFPAVYRRSFDAEHPAFVQFCSLFSTGLGWESLLSAAAKAAGAATGVKS